MAVSWASAAQAATARLRCTWTARSPRRASCSRGRRAEPHAGLRGLATSIVLDETVTGWPVGVAGPLRRRTALAHSVSRFER